MKHARLTLTALLLAAKLAAQDFNNIPDQAANTDGISLGSLGGSRYDADSTANPYGMYGSQYNTESINNPYGMYGSPYSIVSPNDPYTTMAPAIIGR